MNNGKEYETKQNRQIGEDIQYENRLIDRMLQKDANNGEEKERDRKGEID